MIPIICQTAVIEGDALAEICPAEGSPEAGDLRVLPDRTWAPSPS